MLSPFDLQFWRVEWEGASPAGFGLAVPGLSTRSIRRLLALVCRLFSGIEIKMVNDAQPTGRAVQVPVGDIVDIVDDVMNAMDELEQNLQAYEAVHQIVTADSLRAESHLPLLKRDSLSALLGVLNSSFGQRYAAARIAAAAAAGELRAPTSRRPGGPLE